MLRGWVTNALSALNKRFGVKQVVCHQETGGQWTYERDIATIGWCQESSIEFHEWQQFGGSQRATWKQPATKTKKPDQLSLFDE